MLLTNGQLEKLHEVLSMMMVEVKRVCDENNIHYFLMYGSLIGAVRHQGFIPWDDDMDICMHREDYNKFMQIANNKFRNNLFVENYNTSEGYGQVFGKVMLGGTTFEEEFAEGVNYHKNIFIDVFPVDRTTNKIFARKYQYYKCKFISRCLLLNRHYKYKKSGFENIIYHFGYLITAFISKKQLVKTWEKTATYYNNCEKGTFINFAGLYVNMKNDLFTELEDKEFSSLLFERETYTVPKEYDAILKRIYGDYMKFPPKAQQIAHHDLINLDFGTY